MQTERDGLVRGYNLPVRHALVGVLSGDLCQTLGIRSDASGILFGRALLALSIAVGLLAGLFVSLHAAAPNGQVPGLTSRGGIIIEGDIVSLAKRAELPGESEIVRPGYVLTYTLIITNHEPAALPNIVITDTLSAYVNYLAGTTQVDEGGGFAPVADNPESPFFPLTTGHIVENLAPGEAVVLRYRVQVTDSLPVEVDAIANVAEVLALNELITASLALPALGSAAVEIDKRTALTVATEPPGVLVRAGEAVTWTYLITNTGAVTLTSITVTDSDPAVTPTLATGSLDNGVIPGAGVEYTATAIAIAGQYSNTGTVHAEALGGEVVTDTAASYYFGIAPDLVLAKNASALVVAPGTAVTYTYWLTNTGNVGLSGVAVSDDRCGPLLLPEGEAPPEDGLSLGANETAQLICSAVLTTTTTNTATASGLDPLGGLVTTTATTTVTVEGAALTLAKTPSEAAVLAGAVVTYTYAVTNTGDFTVTNIVLVDDLCSPVTVLPGSEDTLAVGMGVGSSAGFQCTAVITQPTLNVATVTGLDPLSNTVIATATAFVDLLAGGIAMEKTPSAPYVAAGSPVTYTYRVTNTGGIAWTGIAVEDDLCAPVEAVTPGADPVEPAASRSFTCVAVIDLDTTNVATATATLITGEAVSTTASAFVHVPLYWLPTLHHGAPESEEPGEEEPPIACALPAGCAIPGAEDVKALAFHAGLSRLYVLSQDAEQVIMLNPVTFEVLGQAATGAQPWALALNETTHRLYVSNFGAGTVSVFDAHNLSLVDTLVVNGNPGEMAVLAGTDLVFVLTWPDSRVMVIDGLAVVQDLNAGGSGPFGIATDTANERVYISHRDSQSLSLLQRAGDAWEAIPGPQFGDGRQYFGVAWNAVTARLYVLTASSDSQWRMEVWQPAATPPWSMLTALAVPSGGIITDPNVGGAGIVVNSATGHIFTANTGAASVSRLEGVNDTLLENLATDPDPFALALDSNTNTIFVGLRAGARVAKVSDAP